MNLIYQKFLHRKNKLDVLITEWLPQLQSSCGYKSYLETNWIRQPEKQCKPYSVYFTPQYTKNICKGVFTNALQSCSNGAGDSIMC